MTNYATGHEAEKVAAAYLKKQKYKIVELNWRRPRAEIDIVARKKRGPVVFFEVKHRKNTSRGRGLEYITSAKLRQMSFAAQLWISENRYKGEIALGAIELTGEDYEVTAFLETLA